MSQTDTPSLICLNPLNFKFLSCPVSENAKCFGLKCPGNGKCFLIV